MAKPELTPISKPTFEKQPGVMPASNLPAVQPVHTPLASNKKDDQRAAHDAFSAIASGDQKPVEELVVNLNNQANKSTQTEQGLAVNEAIQESQLTSGEIAIDRHGLIHHSKDDEETL